ncbi:transposase family protein [Streptomyces atratus]|uniref:transposase family protein n=1 Tax=Streptomyces atratus TaxID=1893 RepID=UPI0032534390
MPALTSSSSVPAVAQLGPRDTSDPTQTVCDLRVFLEAIPDPRKVRGRYRLDSLLCCAIAAVLASGRSLAAAREGATDAPAELLHWLGLPRDPLTDRIRPPHPGTIRLLLTRLDGNALDLAIGRISPPAPRRPAPTRTRRPTKP